MWLYKHWSMHLCIFVIIMVDNIVYNCKIYLPNNSLCVSWKFEQIIINSTFVSFIDIILLPQGIHVPNTYHETDHWVHTLWHVGGFFVCRCENEKKINRKILEESKSGKLSTSKCLCIRLQRNGPKILKDKKGFKYVWLLLNEVSAP